jgi:hypothetical protein
MPFMLLIMEPREQRPGRTPEAGRAVYGRMLQFAETLKAKGVLREVSSLRSDREAVRVTVREGTATLVDGPFAEAKEMVGGFFLLDCETLAEAVAIAAACPAAEWATVEVREAGPCYQP